MRQKFRPGYNLVVDDESGLTVFNDEVTQTWDGQTVRHEWADERHPQTLVPMIPRTPVPVMSGGEALVTAFVCASSFGTVIAGSTVTAPWGPASHLYTQS